MISTAYKFIFLHVPKTGGNSVQTILLPFSDEQKRLADESQDGVERFQLSGAITTTKHMPLQGYANRLGESLADFATIITVRDPIERALSMYYSPSRMLHSALPADRFSFPEFANVVNGMKTLVSFVTVGDAPRMPTHVLRFDALQADFNRVLAELGLPRADLPVLNTSSGPAGRRQELRARADVREVVERKFAPDLEFFAAWLNA
jgi:hypothetical protein